jgi:hypothetical protein
MDGKKQGMGEIRSTSTLDIIMEKTKGLAASEEEKEALRLKELGGKVQGLVQKYLDGLLKIGGLQSALESDKNQERGEMEALMKAALLHRLAPVEDNTRDSVHDNEKILAFLSDGLKVDKAPYEKRIQEFQQRVSAEKTARLERLRQRLGQRGLSGSAVLPNLALDHTWQSFLEEAKKTFQEKLGSI